MIRKTVFSHTNSVVNHFISEMRDVSVHNDSMRFRKNIERLGEIVAYEISKELHYLPTTIQTPLGSIEVPLLSHQPVIATILRAGLPFHYGFLNFFDKAENAFVTAFRKHHEDGTMGVQVDYMACPDLTGKTLIICDPMLATGTSMHLVYEQLVSKRGKPASIHLASIIASKSAVDYVEKNFSFPIHLWIGAVDNELNKDLYIVPGLGDAGDLAFGEKL